ncbi:MAG: molecular chaperone TorD family protein, partial [Bdellovibrionota bacterium]
KAFGLQLNDESEAREMLDHVSREFEFYAILLMKQKKLEESADHEGTQVVLEARKKFLKDHLGRFVGTIACRPGVAGHVTYAAIFNWAKELVADECKELDILPILVGFSGSAEMNEAMSCGATSSLNLSGRTAQERIRDLDSEVSS